ncbi:MAG: FAD-dependent oxidoreductase [Pseudomonadota bacterium]
MPPSADTPDVLVIGGGLHGCSAALHLARRGARVTVIEKDTVGRHASGVNAGGVRRLGRATAEIPLSVRATVAWRGIEDLVRDDCGYRESRYLKIGFTDQEIEDAHRRVAILRQQGFEHEEVIGRERLRELLPAAAPDCLGAILVEGDGYAHPLRTVHAFRRRAEAFGAVFREESPVASLEKRGGTWQATTPEGVISAPVVVNAAGAWGGKLAAQLGDPIPLEAHAPMLAITARMPPFVDGVVGLLGGALSLKQFDNGTVLIGGGVRGRADPANNKTKLDLPGIQRFLGAARRVFCNLASAEVVRFWAGIEGYTPDDLPVIGPGRESGVVHAFGFSAHGFQLAAAVGPIVADLAEGKPPDLDIAAFAPARFENAEQRRRAVP